MKNKTVIYMTAADVLRALGWEVEINEKENYWNLVLTNTNSSEDMPQSHKSCIRGLLRGWLMEFNYEGGRQQVNIYKDLHGLNPEDDRYSCLDTCVKRTDSNIPVYKLDDREIFVRRKDRFDRYVLTEPIDEPLTTRLTCGSKFNPGEAPEEELTDEEKRIRRMAEEYDQLTERYGKLTDFLTTDKFGTLPENTQTLLKRQHQAMHDYRDALRQRIRIDAEAANLKVEINDPDDE